MATDLNNLAVLLYKQKKYQDAKHHMEQALGIRKKALGPDHPLTKQSEGSLQVIVKMCEVLFMIPGYLM